jgi:antirestriction protein
MTYIEDKHIMEVSTQTAPETKRKTSEAQRRASAKWIEKNKEYYKAHAREAYRKKYHTDEAFRQKKIEKNIRWYHDTKAKKAVAAAAAEEPEIQ